MTAIDRKYELTGGTNGPLGNPIEPETSNQDGAGRRRRYERGYIYWHPRGGAYVVLFGTIYEKWSELGRETGELSYPIGDESVDPHHPEIRYQLFRNGKVIAGKTPPAAAVSSAGYSLPRRPYKLILDELVCVRESGRPVGRRRGSDEIRLSIVRTTSVHSRAPNLLPPIRWGHNDVDSGEVKKIGITLVDGLLPDVMIVSLIGLEVDLFARRARKRLKEFERKASVADVNLVRGPALTSAATTAGGVGLGALIGAATGGSVAFFINGVLVGTVGGGVVGALIGAIAGLLVAPIISLGFPELLIVQRQMYSGEVLRRMYDSKRLPTRDGPTRFADTDISLSTWFTFAPDGDLLEHRHFRSRGRTAQSKSDYILTFRHSFP